MPNSKPRRAVDAELAETRVKIGQGEDYRPVLEPEMLQPVVDGLDVLDEVEAETERDAILAREDEIREFRKHGVYRKVPFQE